jgi:hypothetical protein
LYTTLPKLLAQLRDVLEQFPRADEYLAAEAAPGTDPYALLLLVHKRVC